MIPAIERIDTRPSPNWRYVKGLGRVFAGAMLFSLPLLMTMEMWWLGSYLERSRLVQFLLVNLVVLVGLARVSGFEKTSGWGEDVMDAFAAYSVAVAWSVVILWVIGVINADQSTGEIVGKVALQSVPAGFGAMLASKQLGSREVGGDDADRDRASYFGQLFLMLAGALFLGFNLAPTEEMILISFQMSAVQSIILVLISIILLHAIVYTVGFKGQEKPVGPTSFWSIFLRFTITGYAIAALVALYLLWTFGRIGETSATQIVGMVAVLAFPGAIGAAFARLVI